MTLIPITADLHAQLKRSARRRSIGIKVHRGEVTVSAPVRASMAEIRAFVAQKTRWITKHLELQRKSIAQQSGLQFGPGVELPFLGETLLLEATGPAVGVVRSGDRLLIGAESQLYKAKIARWLAGQAQVYLPARIKALAPLLGVEPRGFSVRFYKSRWGSCNRRGELQFNWLLMMAPPAVVDYVVVHELAHLRHFNHSPAFWQLVASVMPDYASHRAWLRQQTLLAW
ncbi:MAG: M48 family metallopeptidase [Cellvibrionaceae bacterium]|nr:M48 family metallopeptidase [Cellvibrionaceae bacterium]